MSPERNNEICENLFKIAQSIAPVRSSRLAACLVYKNEIYAYGFSKMKTHPFQVRFFKNPQSIYLHAETDCIKNALRVTNDKTIAKSTLYVVRAKKDVHNHKLWVYGLAKPCLGCQRAIITYDIKNVIYTTNEGHYKYM